MNNLNKTSFYFEELYNNNADLFLSFFESILGISLILSTINSDLNPTLVKYFIERGADPNYVFQDDDYKFIDNNIIQTFETPLLFLVRTLVEDNNTIENAPNTVSYLLKMGASPYMENSLGENVLQVLKHYDEIVSTYTTKQLEIILQIEEILEKFMATRNIMPLIQESTLNSSLKNKTKTTLPIELLREVRDTLAFGRRSKKKQKKTKKKQNKTKK
jgi:hypothetical protein